MGLDLTSDRCLECDYSETFLMRTPLRLPKPVHTIVRISGVAIVLPVGVVARTQGCS